MVNFKLEIYQAITTSLAQIVLFEEETQQDAKKKMYDIFHDEAAKMEDGEYYATLFRPIENDEKWMRVSGSPVLSCSVRAGVVTMGENRMMFEGKNIVNNNEHPIE